MQNRFTLQFSLNEQALKKIAPYYGISSAAVHPEKIQLTITGQTISDEKLNVQVPFIEEVIIQGAGENAHTLNKIISAELNIRALKFTETREITSHRTLYVLEKNDQLIRYIYNAQSLFLCSLRKRLVITEDALTKVQEPTEKASQEKLNQERKEECNRILDLAETFQKKRLQGQNPARLKPQSESTEEILLDEKEKFQQIKALLREDMEKYQLRAKQRHYPQNIYREYSIIKTLKLLDRKDLSESELFQHLRQHKEAILSNHKQVSQLGLFHFLHTPELVTVYQRALNAIKTINPEIAKQSPPSKLRFEPSLLQDEKEFVIEDKQVADLDQDIQNEFKPYK